MIHAVLPVRGAGGSIWGYRSESESSLSASELTDIRTLQLFFDVLTAVLDKILTGVYIGLNLRGDLATVDENNAWSWWKAKKWSDQIMSCLLSRCDILSYAEDEVKEFDRHFNANVAPQFMGPECDTINL